MASRTTTSGGDYDLSDPVNSFAEVVTRVVLQPSAFFARLPRQGGFLNPLVFALICIEISVLLVGLLGLIDVPGLQFADRCERGSRVSGVLGRAGNRSHSGSCGDLPDGARYARAGSLGGGTRARWVRRDLPNNLLLVSYEPRELDTSYRVDLLLVQALLGHRGNPGDARYDHRQGSARGIATGYLGALIGCGSGGRVGRLVLQGCLRAGTCPSAELPRVPLAYELPRISTLSSRQLGE